MSKGRISNDHPINNPTPNHLCQLLCWRSVRAGYAGGGDMSKVELKPCPFCGGEASLSTVGRSWYRITADHEGFCILEEHESDCPQTDEQLALLVRDWNLRTSSEIDQLKAENEALLKDAERYRWFRAQHWDNSVICAVVDPKLTTKLGSYCPSLELLDQAVDAGMAMSKEP